MTPRWDRTRCRALGFVDGSPLIRVCTCHDDTAAPYECSACGCGPAEPFVPDYHCPKCKSADELDISIVTFARLKQDAEGFSTDTFEAQFADHEWDDQSFAMCRACDWSGTIGECWDVEAEVSL